MIKEVAKQDTAFIDYANAEPAGYPACRAACQSQFDQHRNARAPRLALRLKCFDPNVSTIDRIGSRTAPPPRRGRKGSRLFGGVTKYLGTKPRHHPVATGLGGNNSLFTKASRARSIVCRAHLAIRLDDLPRAFVSTNSALPDHKTSNNH